MDGKHQNNPICNVGSIITELTIRYLDTFHKAREIKVLTDFGCDTFNLNCQEANQLGFSAVTIAVSLFIEHEKLKLPELPCCGYYHCVDGLCTHPDYVSHVKFPVPTRNRTDDKLRRIFYW
ncbi:hypothetical protein J6590_070585 [Homalodisca vitripennis]|nr:hypothetical protein J6590_070585 [Homalodisca vitripennis]